MLAFDAMFMTVSFIVADRFIMIVGPDPSSDPAISPRSPRSCCGIGAGPEPAASLCPRSGQAAALIHIVTAACSTKRVDSAVSTVDS